MRLRNCTLLLSVMLLILSCSDDDSPTDNTTPLEVNLAAMIGVTGEFAESGRGVVAALALATEDINRDLGTQITIQAIANHDTQGQPDSVEPILTRLQQEGVSVVIGTMSSAELTAGKPFADANNMTLISPSSNAPSLSVGGDNIFRLIPDISFQSEATTAMMADDNLQAVITINREDVWGNGFAALIHEKFEAAGGQRVADFSYAAGTQDFASLTAALTASVKNAVDQFGADNVGVFLAAFNEAESLLTLAAQSSVLSSVRWYSTASLAQNPTIVTNQQVADFAAQVGLVSPSFGLDDNARNVWLPVQQRLETELGFTPDVFAMVAYDIVWIIANAFIAAGSDDAQAFRAALPDAAAAYTGITGNTRLNEAGDRSTGNFNFWAVREAGGNFEWQRAGSYNSDTKVLTRE